VKKVLGKWVVVGVVLFTIVQSYGQGLLGRRRVTAPRPASAVAPVSAAQERDFMAHYPTGTNDLGRSCQQQADFDRDFVLPSFLGWTFGDSLESYGAKKLAKPFRLFDTANLCRSAKNRLCEISLELKAKDYSESSISNEVAKLVTILHKQFGIGIYIPRWESSWPTGFRSATAKYANGKTEVEVYGQYYSGDSTGTIKLTVRNRTISKEDQKIKEEEDRIARDKKEKMVSVADEAGVEMLVAKRPNVSTDPKDVKFGVTFGMVGPEELLEPIMSLEEAVKLAKKDDPKGYYQMSIIISRRRNWRDREFDAYRYAKACWDRAVTAGYKNALAIDAIMKDDAMEDECRSCDAGYELAWPSQLVRKYSGLEYCFYRRAGSLASPEDVKAQRALYEDVIKMGCPQMTNALAFFEWRVARVAAKKAKDAVAKADSDELAELVKSVVILPKKETQKDRSKRMENRSKRIAAAAKASRGVYIKTADDKQSAATGWDDKQGKPLTIEFWDAWNGDVREFRFSADGKLMYVSPAAAD